MQWKQIYRALEDKIACCEYEPGMMLSEIQTAAELGTSPAVIHDVFLRLADENLLFADGENWQVAGITLATVNHVYEARIVIEPYILREYCRHLNDTDLMFLRVAVQQAESADGRGFLHWDDEFHGYLQGKCDNPSITQFLNVLRVHNRRLRAYAVSASDFAECRENSIAEHRRILQKLMISRSDEAAEVLEQHLIGAKKYICQALAEKKIIAGV